MLIKNTHNIQVFTSNTVKKEVKKGQNYLEYLEKSPFNALENIYQV